MNYLLIAEDDEDDRFLALEALKKSNSTLPTKFVHNGEELMNFLTSEFSNENIEKPGLILLDLNMPKKDGRECLKEIKENPLFKKIPIVVLTTSNLPEDITRTYDLGVNSFINKPVDFNELTDIFSLISKYWFNTVKLPNFN